tara:strand:+ start:128 stop:346 length:219 start_codon:yes stop_codon:yes gene_type:complete
LPAYVFLSNFGSKLLKMQFKDIVEGLGDFFEWTFGILPILGNIPNILFLLIGSVLFLYWMMEMRKHSKAGEN